MITPTTDYVSRTGNLVQLGNLALPVLVEEWMIEMGLAIILNKIFSPVVQMRVTVKLLARWPQIFSGSGRTYTAMNWVSGIPPFRAISRYRSVMPSNGRIAYFYEHLSHELKVIRCQGWKHTARDGGCSAATSH